MSLSNDWPCNILPDLTKLSTPYDIFIKQYTISLFIHIAHCTNERLKLYEKAEKVKICKTNPYEIICIYGCIFVMCYNRLPSINSYWSSRKGLGNDLIKSTIS